MKFIVSALLLAFGLSSCGYTLRGSSRPFFDRHGIKTLYVPPVKNQSYKAGAEITLYNALRKKMAQGGYVSVINDANLADATLSASVMDASYAPAAITTADQIAPLGSGPNTVQIASSYDVTLKVAFILTDNKTNKVLWRDVLRREKIFAATTYIGALGSTSALINDSDFERTLNDLSVGICEDAEELINSIF